LLDPLKGESGDQSAPSGKWCLVLSIPKTSKVDHVTSTALHIANHQLASTCTFNTSIKSGMPTFTHYKDIENTPKIKFILWAHFKVFGENRGLIWLVAEYDLDYDHINFHFLANFFKNPTI